MSIFIHTISRKPNIRGEVGLPKVNINSAKVDKNGLVGDYNNFRQRKKNNDRNMGLMILSNDILEQFNMEGWSVQPGDLGENITLGGIQYHTMKAEQKYEFSNGLLIEITMVCKPCKTLGVLPYIGKKNLNNFIKTSLNRRGWYAKVLKPGYISIGDSVVLR